MTNLTPDDRRSLAYSATPDALSSDDLYQLRVLAYCHATLGALSALAGIMVAANVPESPKIPIAVMVVGGLLEVVAGWLLYIKRRLWLPLCASVLTLCVFPMGTILGIATINVLRRPGVAAAFVVKERHSLHL